MRIQNFTKMDTDWLREVIRFVCPAGVSGFDIAFKNTSHGYRGMAYIDGCSYHASSMRAKGKRASHTTPFVTIGIDRRRTDSKWTKPIHTNGGNGYLPIDIYSNEEAIVLYVAHELRHLWQRRVKKGYRVWGARGQYSERDADSYGLRMLRAWRRR